MDYVCVYCQTSITGLRIKCNICIDYELCLECFSCGAESGAHKADHEYQPLNDGFQPLFHTTDAVNWTGKEELTLLESIEQYGLGNWEAISYRLDNKSSEEVKEHHDSHYISGTIGSGSQLKSRKYKVTDHTGPVQGPLSPTLTVPLPPINLTIPEARELGFLPLRDDFEREWDNDAESMLSGAIIHHADEEVDMAYKLSLVSMYRLRLEERRLRKKVARDYNLVSIYTSSFRKGHAGAKKKGVREYKDFQEKMKRFCPFMTLHEHERFFNSLQREKQLKSRIKELIKYRKNGITTLEDAEEFEREASRRERNRDLAKKDKKLAASSNSSTTESHTPKTSPSTPISKRSHSTPNNLPAVTEDNDMTPHCPIPEKRKRSNPVSLPKLAPVKDVLTEKPLHNLRSPTNGCHLRDILSENEKRFCRRIGMKTASYVTIKTSILKDYVNRQHGTPVKLRFPAEFDKTHRRTILNFLEHSGWLQLEN
ncbi:transcriptional adapter 2-beta-like [Watersipora subatra]|uniref:transcriptional adapter 2-beta-like n=1 Tax=Watersipora subatra TaxID=2589382 RepID=UPI00355C8F17